MPATLVSARDRLVDTLLGAGRLQVGTDPILADLTASWLRSLIGANGHDARTADELKTNGRRLFQDGAAVATLVDRVRGSGLPPDAFLLITPRRGSMVLKTRPGTVRGGTTIASFSLRRPAADKVDETTFARLAAEIARARPTAPGTPANDGMTSVIDGLIAVQRQSVVRLGAAPPAERMAAELRALAEQAGVPQFLDRFSPIVDEITRLLRDAASVADVAGMLALPPASTVLRLPDRAPQNDDRPLRRLVAAARAVAGHAGADRRKPALGYS